MHLYAKLHMQVFLFIHLYAFSALSFRVIKKKIIEFCVDQKSN